MKLLPLLTCLVLTLPGFSQNITVTGKLVDSLSGEPVRSATLYINQTQIITQSDANGRFKITLNQSPAALLITHVGYQKRAVYITASKDSFLIRLFPRKDLMDEVTVNGKYNWEKDWKRWGDVFTEYFIGKDMERKCVLLNPEAVRFRFDKSQMTLRAWAKKPLLIENKMLGYVIHVDLDSFRYSFRNTTFLYNYSSYYEPVKVSDVAVQKTLAANRLAAYDGSEMHFMRTVFTNAADRQGFRLYKYVGTVNREKRRVRQQVLQAQFEQRNAYSIDISARERDTIEYYKARMAEPSYFFKDSVRVNVADYRQNNGPSLVSFNLSSDTFLLEYDPAANQEISSKHLKRWANLKEPDQYLDEVYNFIQQPKYNSRYSLLSLTEGNALQITGSGKVMNSANLLVQGFLSQRRMAYDLPWDYEPAKDYVQITDEPGEGSMESRIADGLAKISDQHSSSDLYLHLDKTSYDHEENIWFAAYVLQSAVNIDEHKTLYVFLKDKQGRQKIASQQFVLSSGYGAGYLFIPDSVAAGNYKLVAYTNTYTKEPGPLLFEQDITIRPYATGFTVAYSESRNKFSGDSVYINFDVRNDKNIYAGNANVSYVLQSNGKSIASGKKKVNDYGELVVGLPLREVLGKWLTLESDIKLNSTAATVQTPVFVKSNYAKLKYYPEGGDLVDGLPSRLMLELKDLDHKPLTVSGKLLENDQPIGTFKTDGAGIANVQFTPHAAARYTVQLQDSIPLLQDSFPQILPEGLTVRVQQGVVKDSVQINIFTSKPGTDAFILLHNYKTNYFLGTLHFNGQRGTVTLSTADMPPGLATITIFNDKGMPVAERCIYKEPAQQPTIKITLDSASYDTRSKLTARITSTDGNGNPIPGLVSLACVVGKRLDTLSFQDITSFFYLNAYSGTGLISGRPNVLPPGNYLEEFLLVQGWTRYAWQSMLAETNNSNQNFTLVQKGTVLYNNKRIRKPVDVIVYKSDSFAIVKTDANGNLEVPLSLLTTQADWKINFAVNADKKEGYSITFQNDNDELQKMLAATETPEALRMVLLPEDGKPEKGVLAPVVVKSSNNVNPLMTRSGCNDWVCMYNIFDCPNHPTGEKPQVGHQYRMYTLQGIVPIIYTGCTEVTGAQTGVVFQLSGRYYTKQFYVADYEKFNPQFPEKFTTLYWNPYIAIDEKGEALISFYTNDLNGRMVLVAQGITDDGPVSARKEFLVK